LPAAQTGAAKRRACLYNPCVPVSVRSFAKINIGLRIGAKRPDGFHDLYTVYQTIALHDTLRVDVQKGVGIEIRCKNPLVPTHETNTCYRIADRVLRSLKQRSKIIITIDKQLPVQGGLGSGSSNGVATLFALERLLKQELDPDERLRITSEVGSDLPLFLMGGTVLGVGRGEEVLPLADQPTTWCVIVTPSATISTPEAFADWDRLAAGEDGFGGERALTSSDLSVKMSTFSRALYLWLRPATGVPTKKSGGRAESPLLDLVRAGIENDFERVVFPQHPELRDLKRALEREGARYSSLSGSGSTVYGLFEDQEQAERAAKRITETKDVPAFPTRTLTRAEYWEQMFQA
jgi:4-diphosphocytidyl-2-C-methyl-D-erythritol kinase